jgi:hypothetical protein
MDHHDPARWSRVTSVVLAVTAAVLARLLMPADEFTSLSFVGGFVGGSHGGLMWAANRGHGPAPLTLVGRVARGAAAGLVLVVTGGCLSPLAGPAGTVAAVGLVLGVLLGRRFLLTRPAGGVRAPAVEAAVQADLPLPPLPQYTTAELGDAWVRSQQVLPRIRALRDRARLVALRQAYLDELERRDAAGVRRWLESGCALHGDPRPYLHPRPDEAGPTGS